MHHVLWLDLAIDSFLATWHDINRSGQHHWTFCFHLLNGPPLLPGTKPGLQLWHVDSDLDVWVCSCSHSGSQKLQECLYRQPHFPQILPFRNAHCYFVVVPAISCNWMLQCSVDCGIQVRTIILLCTIDANWFEVEGTFSWWGAVKHVLYKSWRLWALSLHVCLTWHFCRKKISIFGLACHPGIEIHCFISSLMGTDFANSLVLQSLQKFIPC